MVSLLSTFAGGGGAQSSQNVTSRSPQADANHPPRYAPAYGGRPEEPRGLAEGYYTHTQRFGFRVALQGVMYEPLAVSGVSLSFRFRPRARYAFDLGLSMLSGFDERALRYTQVPLYVAALIYLNPDSIAQVYLRGAVDLMRSSREGFEEERGRYDVFREHSSALMAGVGTELRVGQAAAITGEVHALSRLIWDQAEVVSFGKEASSALGGISVELGLLTYF